MRAAIYARYSTDLQRAESIEDQIRVCEGIAERHGMRVVERFDDKGISGGTTVRPGYQRMLAAVRRGEFDAVIAEDTSRLWRSMAEQSPRLAELCDLGVHVVTLDIDTRNESAGILSAVKGTMAEEYRKEIGRRTRRGLDGNARRKAPTGGKAYGYDCRDKTRRVNPAEAAIVVRIFEMYADGYSPRAIADVLNRDRVPSPGSTWNRTERRRTGWQGSAIAGDTARGVGILNCDTYRGVIVWNRNRWVRAAADSSKRRIVPNPPSAWVVHTDESLRIVPQELWDRVKARQREQANTVGERVKAGLSRSSAKSTGRGPKFLLSSVMKCGECGANFVIMNATHYGCASRVNGGRSACANDATFRRDEVEAAICQGIRTRVLAPDAVAEVAKRVRARLRQRPARPDPSARIAELEATVGNLADAIAAGALRSSPAIAARLRAAEDELATLRAAPPVSRGSVERLVPDIEARVRRVAERLAETISGVDTTRARNAIREYLGTIEVRSDAEKIRFYNAKGHPEVALSRAAGSAANYCGSGGRI